MTLSVWRPTWSSLTDLQRAIDVGTEAVAEAEPGSPLWPRLNSNLGSMHLDRHERTGDAADLDRAIALARVAVDAAPPGPSSGALTGRRGS
jgi:hypothetical protein